MFEIGSKLKISQSVFTRSKLTVETLKQDVKYVKVNNKDPPFWCLYC